MAVLLAACGSDDLAQSAQSTTKRGSDWQAGETAPDSTGTGLRTVGLAALDPSALPTDVDVALGLLDDLPDEVNGLRRMPDETDGEVRYGAEGQLFVVVMEASDVGVNDETNAELLFVESRRKGRTVIAQETNESAPLLYVAGTEGDPPLHFLLWTTPDNPLVFAAGADSADGLNALLRAFTRTAT